MNTYKKMALLGAMTIATMSGDLLARCQSCAEKMAIKQSIKEALAAAAAKPSKKADVDSLEDVKNNNVGKCPCSNDPKIKAARESACADSNAGSCSKEQLVAIECMIEQLSKNNAWCCKKLNSRIKEQGEDSKKCCKHIRHELNEIEDLIISQSDAAATCCSATEALLLSQIVQTAICCSVTEALLTSQIDQQAACCSVIETNLGDPCSSSVVDILDLLEIPQEDITLINAACLDTLTLLKSIYALLTQIFLCTCGG